MPEKLPAIQWYPGDWRKDPAIQSLDYETRGIWFEMLMIMCECEQRGRLVLNGKAIPMDGLARILGIEITKLNHTLEKLKAAGVPGIEPETGIWFNRRMVRDEHLRSYHRLNGMKGGRPSTKANCNQDEPNESPSSSTSSSTSSSDIQTAFTTFWTCYPRKVENRTR